MNQIYQKLPHILNKVSQDTSKQGKARGRLLLFIINSEHREAQSLGILHMQRHTSHEHVHIKVSMNIIEKGMVSWREIPLSFCE